MNKPIHWLALVSLLFGLLSGCGRAQPTPQDDPQARQAVLSALRAQAAQPAFQIYSLIVAGVQRAESRVEYQSPDRFHVRDDSGEVVVIGRQALTLKDGAWVDAGAPALDLVAGLNDPAGVDAVEQSMVAARLVGAAMFDNQPVKVYEYDTRRSAQGAEMSMTAKLWVSDASGLPVKREAEISASDRTTTLMTLYTYDPAVTVEDPASK
jgi:hypothetical protein